MYSDTPTPHALRFTSVSGEWPHSFLGFPCGSICHSSAKVFWWQLGKLPLIGFHLKIVAKCCQG